MSTTPFMEYPTSSAAEFLDYLHLSNPIWKEGFRNWRHDWLFRGQGSSSHPIIPSAWRSDYQSDITRWIQRYIEKQNVDFDRKMVKVHLERGPRFGPDRADDQIIEKTLQLYYRTCVELELINRLLAQVLLRGVSVPDYLRLQEFLNRYIGDPTKIVERLAGLNFDGLDNDFGAVMHNNSFFALAQHHGLPTRLLDWTRSPQIAAFFAAESALKSKNKEKLAVFAVHELVSTARGIINFPFPRSDNPYLHAQKGELTIYHGSSRFLFTGSFPTVNQILSEGSDWNQEIQPIMITLPVDRAPDLIRLLAITEGIARDQLMPTFDNIVRVTKLHYEIDLFD